jgi:hypothetical protein
MSENTMESILALLQESQGRERELYATLRADTTNKLTAAERESIVADINSESETRREYYNVIESANAMMSDYTTNVESASATQLNTLRMLEDQLDAAKGVLSSMSDVKLNQMKMIEINTFFGKQYEAYSGMAIVVVLFLLALMIPVAVRTYLNAPEVADVLSRIIWWVGGLYLFYRLVDMILRRNDNYDEYTWPFAPRTDMELKDANTSGNIIDISGIDLPDLCLGAYCCGPGTTWDDAGCIVKGSA